MNEPVDLFKSFNALQAAHDGLLEQYVQLGDPAESSAEFWTEVQELLDRAQATGALMHETNDRLDRRASQSILDFWAGTLYRAGRPFPDIRLAPFNPDLARPLPDKPCPYQGLSAFDEDRHEFFFGREKLVDQMVGKLHGGARLLIVLGASGSGKSSVVRAGLLQALKAGVLPGSENWRYITMMPGADAVANLNRALQRSDQESARPEPEPAGGSVSSADDSWPGQDNLAGVATKTSEQPIVLVVDQFEELFTLCDDRREYKEFENRLLRLVDEPQPSHIVILTMRTDFEEKLPLLPEVHRRLDAARINVQALGLVELREAIEKPAADVGLKFDSGIVDDLITKILGQGAGLPLLQFTLLQLWEKRDRNRVTEEVYERVGDPLVALGRSADTFMGKLIPEERKTAKRIFLQMVSAEEREVTSRRISLEEVFRRGGAKDRVERVVYRLVCEARLAKLSGTTTDVCSDESEYEEGALFAQMEEERNRGNVVQIEVAHEALVRNWETLGEWLEEKRDLRRRTRQLAVASVVMVILLIIAWIIAARAIQNAARAARSATSLRLAMASIRSLEIDPQDGLLLTLYAVSATYPVDQIVTVAAEDALHRAVRVPMPRFTLEGHTGTVNGVAFSRDGTRLATASADRTAKVWDPETGEVLFTLVGHGNWVNGVAFSPDGTYLATASADKTAKVWDLETRKVLFTLAGHDGFVYGVAFSSDGKRLATASADKTTKVWDLETHKELFTLEGHDGFVNGAAFSPDGKRLATASADKTARVWDTETRALLFTLTGHSDAVQDLAFSTDGALLATASADATVKVWDAKTGQLSRTVTGPTAGTLAVAFSPDGRWLVASSLDGTAKVWDANEGKELFSQVGHRRKVLDLAFSPDGKWLATASADTTAKVWDVTPDDLVFVPLRHSNWVNGVVFSPDATIMVSVSADGTAKVWDATSGQERFTLPRHGGAVNGVALSYDGTRLATASADGAVKVWDVISRTSVLTLTGHARTVNGVAFSPDGTRLATASADRTVRVWDAKSGQALRILSDHTDAVYAVAFSPDGKRLATAGKDSAKVWDTATSEVLFTLSGHTGAVQDIVFSSDGTLLATAGDDGTAKVWKADSGQNLSTLIGHDGTVYSVAFSPDGKRLITASKDWTAKVWDAASGQELFTLSGHTGPVRDVALSPEGMHVATASEDGTVRVTTLDIEELIAKARQRVAGDMRPEKCLAYFGEEGCPPLPSPTAEGDSDADR